MFEITSSVKHIVLVSVLTCFGVAQSSSECNGDSLVSYKLTVYTFWSQQAFPKHYPDTRPVAQWSKLYGVSHSDNLTLYQVGTLADKSLQQFAELGRADEYESTLNHSRVLSQFYAPPIRKGVGLTSTTFFVNAEHSKVSFVMKIHPSPDWFIGMDRLSLCQNGTWVQNQTIDAIPMDAGTDEGFTFTAPDYANEVPQPVFRITSTYPEEPYGSFYYKNLTQLPPMAQFVITKVQEYVTKAEPMQNTSIRPDDEPIQNTSKTLVDYPQKETFNTEASASKTKNSTQNKTDLEHNKSTSDITTPFTQLQTIINQIELKQNNSSETLNQTSSENSSEFQSRKRRKRKNIQNIKSVVQILKEIINNEEGDSLDNEMKNEHKQRTSGNHDQDTVSDKSISKQQRSAKGNKTSKRRSTQHSNKGHRKRHEQSKHKRELYLIT